MPENNENRGFASMSEEERRKIAKKGGEASHQSDKGEKGGRAEKEDTNMMEDLGDKAGETMDGVKKRITDLFD